MSSTISNFGYPETAINSQAYFRPPSSLSLPSNSGDSGFLTSNFGSASISATNSRTGICSTSGNTSVGSSPIPTEQDIDQILCKAVELLTLRSQALKQANASQIVDPLYRNAFAGFYDFKMVNSATTTTTTTKIANDSKSTTSERKQTNQSRQKNLPPVARRSLKPESYKTVMCQAWLESGMCSFGENCRFAHGEEELRPCKLPTKNPKYKTKLCDKYTLAGLCPYGDRCLFIHPEASVASNPYVRPDRYLKMQRERALLASMKGTSSGISQTPLSSRTTNRPPPSWPLESPAFFSAHRDLDQLLKKPHLIEQGSSSLFMQSSPATTIENLNRTPALNDITNQAMASFVQVTPNITTNMTSGHLKANYIVYDSPDSGISNNDCTTTNTTNADANASQSNDMPISSDYPFQVAIHTDNLARSLACEFKVD